MAAWRRPAAGRLIQALLIFGMFYSLITIWGAKHAALSEKGLSGPVSSMLATDWLRGLKEKRSEDCRQLLNDGTGLRIYQAFAARTKFNADYGEFEVDRTKERDLLYFVLGTLPTTKTVCLTGIDTKESLNPWLLSYGRTNIHILDTTGSNYYSNLVGNLRSDTQKRVKVKSLEASSQSVDPDLLGVSCDVIVLSDMTSTVVQKYVESAIRSLKHHQPYIVLENYKPDIFIATVWDSFLTSGNVEHTFKCDYKQEETYGIAIGKISSSIFLKPEVA